MDSRHNSPVLLQHPSSPHTLSPHMQNISEMSHLPESVLTSTSLSQEDLTRNRPNMPHTQQIGEMGPESSPQPEQMAEQHDPTPGAEESSSQTEMPVVVDVAEYTPSEGAPPVTASPETVEQIPRETEPGVAATDEEDVAETNPLQMVSEDYFASDASDRPTADPTTRSTTPLEEVDPPPPPPPPPVEEPKPEIPDWVKFEEDTSVPDDEELKEIEASTDDTSATDFKSHEKFFFHELEDPEQRPLKRFRMSWTIKGVRGTKENPNYARVINSPAAYVDGLYWHIKFFPRGNNSTAMSCYIKCSKKPPPADPEIPESEFAVYRGDMDADLGSVKPEVDLKIPASSTKSKEGPQTPSVPARSESEAKKADPESSEDVSREEVLKLDAAENTSAIVVEEEEEDWRVSAQLGIILYNPIETRSGVWSSSEHQFNKHNDDWGWTNFSGPWNEIHRRRRGQREALLRRDMIAMDAYIQIFEDPTQALWWHPAPESENQWDSKSLAGYFPMGTPPLYHSPGVAGITALLLLAPFRKILQALDTSPWRKDSQIRPQPLLCQLQLVLYLMRTMRKSETYVNVNHVLETLDNFGEMYWDVKTFWEVFRRSVELELRGNDSALKQIAEIFDGRQKDDPNFTLSRPITIPVVGVANIQEGLELTLKSVVQKTSLPNFLPVLLDRQKFDQKTREWQILHNRVILSEEIDLSSYSSETDHAKYTLYGFMAHVGERTSGKFYSVLRPNGPGTKWLAFEDGDGNKVFSYTKRRVEKFEGLEGEELKSFKGTNQTAYMAMYIRTSCLNDYLPGSLEPYDMPDWLKPHLSSGWHGDEKDIISTHKPEAETQIEVYFSSSAKGRRGLLDMCNLKDVKRDGEHFHAMTVSSETTFAEVRQKLAQKLDIEKVEKLRLWMMQYSGLGEYMTASMIRVQLADEVGPETSLIRPLCLWLVVLEDEDDVKRYGYADPSLEEVKARQAEMDEQAVVDDAQDAPIDSEQPPTAGEVLVRQDPPPDESEAVAQDSADEASAADENDTEPVAQHNSVGSENEAPSAGPDLVQASVDEAVRNDTGEATATGLPMLGAATESAEEEISDTNNEAETAAPDLEQDSVNSAIRDSLGSTDPIPDNSPAAVAVPEADNNQQASLGARSEIQVSNTADPPQQSLVPVAQLFVGSDTNPVVHGHLVEAVELVGDPVPGTTDVLLVSGMEPEDAALIASIIAADVQAIEDGRSENDSTIDANDPHVLSEEAGVNPESGEADVQHVNTETAREEEIIREVEVARLPKHVYGFIQTFDVKEQNFVVFDSFFADWNADVKATVRKYLGYEAEREILVWQRIKAYNTSPISSSTTFSDINFRDGVDLIVGDVLSDETKDELLAEAKFVTPSSLSRVIWMSERNHPIQAFTGNLTLNDFGGGFYSGPLVKGRYHGEYGHWITANGHEYKGPFVADEKSGDAGVMTFQNGDVYEGSWFKDEKHGQGTFVEKRTGNKYVGGFENGKRWGEGVTYWKVADEQSDMCQICYCEEIDALFYDCGHVCACVDCAKQCESCPICRKPIQKVVKMYKA